jgi:hypothetical protein
MMGVAFREEMAEGEDRDAEDREVPAERDREIDAAVVVLAVVFGAIILFQLVFG